MSEHKPHSKWQEQRARIVEVLNLPSLVPPQVDDETIKMVDEAWDALYQTWLLVVNLEEQYVVMEENLAAYQRTIVGLKEQLGILVDALWVALELVDLERNGLSLGEEFPESRDRIVHAISNPATKLEDE